MTAFKSHTLAFLAHFSPANFRVAPELEHQLIVFVLALAALGGALYTAATTSHDQDAVCIALLNIARGSAALLTVVAYIAYLPLMLLITGTIVTACVAHFQIHAYLLRRQRSAAALSDAALERACEKMRDAINARDKALRN